MGGGGEGGGGFWGNVVGMSRRHQSILRDCGEFTANWLQMAGDLKNIKEPYKRLCRFSRDTTKILQHPPPSQLHKKWLIFYLCVLAAHFMELRTKNNSSFYLCVQPARFMELKTGFRVELALQNIHKLDSFLFLKIPHFDVIQEISIRYHL